MIYQTVDLNIDLLYDGLAGWLLLMKGVRYLWMIILGLSVLAVVAVHPIRRIVQNGIGAIIVVWVKPSYRNGMLMVNG